MPRIVSSRRRIGTRASLRRSRSKRFDELGSRHRARDPRPAFDGLEDILRRLDRIRCLPNTQTSAIDIALPGVLPSLNKGAVERAIKFGLAVNGTINRRSVFARKNYFYPDLPKGYQISQYEIPIVQGGWVRIVSPTRGELDVRLTLAH